MSHRIAYTDEAKAGRGALVPKRRKDFDTGVAVLARAPYGCGSRAVKGDRDRRDATIGCVAVIRYEVSSGVLTITVLRVVPAP
ncbi:hypothetical protein [Streptomyces uncialis]|uniref:Uncharacterized protein n=1 Tax=Streptomyces uncialis TaxID=1048205 RepID=A0A1Q4VEJ5_9ACTN|nr:hypothetical protein [Streptomyces uncialis]OKH96224.1 hypothetical protein AB852_06185 [Streptomyces uncialis]